MAYAADTAADLSDSEVLVFAPAGRDADVACDMLRRAGLAAVPCRSADDLLRRVTEGSGPIVIAAESLPTKVAERLGTQLDAQPPWSDLPLIILSGQNRLPPSLKPLTDRPALELLQRPIKAVSFVTTVRTAVQSRLRQYQVRDLLQELRQRTEQIQRLALRVTEAEERERRRLADILHDDLQQILVGVVYHAGRLPKIDDPEELERAAGQVSDLLHRAIAMSRELSHDLSPPMLRQHGLVPALKWLADRMRELHGIDVDLDASDEAELPPTPLRVFVFRTAQELLFNVAKHAETDRAKVKLSRTPEGIRLRVEDAGCGFHADEVEGGDGAPGLGLVSIRERADLMGGSLDVRSTPGGGSCFTLAVPAPREQAAEGTQEAAPAARSEAIEAADDEQDTSQPLRVALVDDHRVMRRGLRALLNDQEGIEVVGEAGNGTEAIELVDRLHPDLVLMDVAMPGMNGIEATREIKARHPEVRIVGLSMFDDGETAARMRAAGAERYLAKTGSSDLLLAAVLADREPE